VIENVENAPLRNPLKLCGTIFSELRVLRHRLFETNFPVPDPGSDCYNHPQIFSPDNGLDPYANYVTVAGGLNCPTKAAASAMGIDWMNRTELSQSIPPAYTHYIGKFLKLWIS
jgi:DNA (cytosine-5)-methyltransferase 1